MLTIKKMRSIEHFIASKISPFKLEQLSSDIRKKTEWFNYANQLTIINVALTSLWFATLLSFSSSFQTKVETLTRTSSK